MKKIYIQPSMKVIDIELESLIADSPTLIDTEADENDGDVTSDENGGGDGLSRGGILWETW